MRAVGILILILFVGAVGVGIYMNVHQSAQSDAPVSSEASTTPQEGFATLPDAYSTPGQRSYYVNKTFGFTFEKPSGSSIEEYGVADPDPQVLLKGSNGSKAMLVWIYPVGGVTQVTNSLVQKLDPSSSTPSNVSVITVGNASGVSFDADTGSWDDGHQYWFIHNGTLFRVYTARAFQDVDAAVLGTWQFMK